MQNQTHNPTKLAQAKEAIIKLDEEATKICKLLREQDISNEKAGKLYQSFLAWLLDWRESYAKNFPQYPIAKPPKTENQLGLFGTVQITTTFAKLSIDNITTNICDYFNEKYK
jgi:hypothetical protein